MPNSKMIKELVYFGFGIIWNLELLICLGLIG